ncbi:MAG: DUF2797 domain-containing protein [Proteobacteria bacterium]|nr:MAG: DUF2797 domain-containing protein [Pseudomonadota bacterium]
MKTEYSPASPVTYRILSKSNPSDFLSLNDHLGKKLKIEFKGEILCIECGRKTKKSYSQGHCFVCSRDLARNDMCSVRPELCHYSKGTCREPEWGVANCMIPHTLYLANSSGLKVGITRAHHRMTRWIDQGAVEAIPVVNLNDRFSIGVLETKLKANFADKTNWRNMLKGETPPIDLLGERKRLATLLTGDEIVLGDEAIRIEYPVLEHPKKIVSLNLEKTPLIEGTLQGIKGQYLIFETGVINIRSFSGYSVEIS